MDPVEGGVENNYVYPPDPVNKQDLNGMWAGLIVRGGAAACSKFKKACGKIGRGASNKAYKAKEYIRNGNNWFRMGPIDGRFRVSVGPAPRSYQQMPRWKKVVAPIHIHVEKRKIGVDFNWFKNRNYYRSW